MNSVKLKYVHTSRTGGKTYHYFRFRGSKVRLPDNPGSAEFLAAYADLLKQAKQAKQDARIAAHAAPMLAPGSLAWLIANYRCSPEFSKLRPKTKDGYARMLEKLRPFGNEQITSIQRRHIRDMRDMLRDKPRTADEFVKVMRILFGYAVDLDIITTNPAKGIKTINVTKPYRAWTDTEVEAFDAACPPGPLRTAFLLALHTGQRRGDIVNLTWGSYDGERITVRQEKTSKPLSIKVHFALKAHLDSLDRGTTLLIVALNGSSEWREDLLNKQFRQVARKAGLPDDVYFHGLRKTAAKLMVEAGCSQAEVKAVTGHASDHMVNYYSREADQVRLGDSAVTKREVASKTKK